MIIKFLPVGTGDPKRAVSYLLGELDHKGDKRADVEILEGDPFTFSALAESASFKYCYTSVVIAWSPQDQVTDDQISEVVSGFREHIGAGLEQDQYHMTVIMHREDDGSGHLHILIPRMELRTGKSFNVAPPGHRHYFDPLRDYFNYKYDWIRPDDVTHLNQKELPQHLHFQDAKDVKANLDGLTDQKLTKDERLKIIDRYVLNLINSGDINNREELVGCLKRLGKVNRQGKDYISLKHATDTDRLRGKFYGMDFSFKDYQINQRRLKQGICESEQLLITNEERLKRAEKCFKEMHRVRAKRAEYNHKYYQPKGLKGQTIDQEILDSELNINSMLNRFIPKDESSPDDMSRIYDPKNLSIDKIKKNQVLPHQTHTTTSMHETDAIVELNSKLVAERFSSFDEVEQTTPQINLGRNLIKTTSESSISKSLLIDWEINSIKHSLNYQKSTRMEGVKYERYTITDLKKPTDCPVRGDSSKSRTATENKGRGNSNRPKCDPRAESLHQRTRELAEATARLSRAYEERKLSYEQETQRYEFEVNRAGQDHQVISRGTAKRDFIERAHRIFRETKIRVRNTFEDVIKSLLSATPDPRGNRWRFKAISERVETIGVSRLVNIARQRTERKQRIENVKRFKQELERTKELSKRRRALNTMSAELSCIQENFPELELRPALGFVSIAERCFHQYRDANKSDEDIDLYLGEYIYSIDECFKFLEIKLNTMQAEELNTIKKLSTIIEGHLDQIKFEIIVEDETVHYESAKQEVKGLVAAFREKLGKHERILINNMFDDDGLIHPDLDKRRHQPDRLYNSDYDNFS